MDRSPAEILVEQAAAYARGRPDYPPAIEGWLCGTLGLRAGKAAVDLGSGTGKFLPRLIATGADVTAIEPLAEMRAHLTALHPQIDAREGRAQALPLTDSSVDAVICAQSFHLFATAEALAEIRRVLKPDGALGLLWNLRDDSVPWVARIIDIMAVFDHDNIAHVRQDWRRAFPAPGFSALEEQSFPNPQKGSPETVIIDRVLSVSAIAKLPRPERDRLIAKVRDVIAGAPDLAGKTEIVFPNRTLACSCRKTA